MAYCNQTKFVKRVRVKGHPRTDSRGITYMVSPHFRTIRNTDCASCEKRRKLIQPR